MAGFSPWEPSRASRDAILRVAFPEELVLSVPWSSSLLHFLFPESARRAQVRKGVAAVVGCTRLLHRLDMPYAARLAVATSQPTLHAGAHYDIAYRSRRSLTAAQVASGGKFGNTALKQNVTLTFCACSPIQCIRLHLVCSLCRERHAL